MDWTTSTCSCIRKVWTSTGMTGFQISCEPLKKNHKFKQVHQWTNACCHMISRDTPKKVHQTGEISIDWPDCQMSLHSAKRWTRKALQNFFTPFSILAFQRNHLGQSSPISALMYNKDQTINVPNFIPFWQPVYEIPPAELCWFLRKHDW